MKAKANLKKHKVGFDEASMLLPTLRKSERLVRMACQRRQYQIEKHRSLGCSIGCCSSVSRNVAEDVHSDHTVHERFVATRNERKARHVKNKRNDI